MIHIKRLLVPVHILKFYRLLSDGKLDSDHFKKEIKIKDEIKDNKSEVNGVLDSDLKKKSNTPWGRMNKTNYLTIFTDKVRGRKTLLLC